jgi:3-deoxy-7-phosphoheptulonate synthase
MPVGFKNGTDGGLQVALNAMISARHPHSFLGMDSDGATAVVRTLGNPDRHVVLRGGGGRPNYYAGDVDRAVELFAEEGIERPIMVDCSHDQTAKDPERQPEVARAVVEQFVEGQDALMGIMVESNLRSGRQTWREGAPLEYGVSITDPCIGWETTEALLNEIERAVATR